MAREKLPNPVQNRAPYPLSCDQLNCLTLPLVRMLISIVPFSSCAAWHSLPPPFTCEAMGSDSAQLLPPSSEYLWWCSQQGARGGQWLGNMHCNKPHAGSGRSLVGRKEGGGGGPKRKTQKTPIMV
jgi:hypothetical protein